MPWLTLTGPEKVLAPESVRVPFVVLVRPAEPASTPETVPARASTSVVDESEPEPEEVIVPEEMISPPTVSVLAPTLSVPPATVTVEASSKTEEPPKARVPALTVVPAL